MEYTWKLFCEIKDDEIITKENFWNGIQVWIERPHLLNRRLLAAELYECSVISHGCLQNDLSKQISFLFQRQCLGPRNLNHLLSNFKIAVEMFKNNDSEDQLKKIFYSDCSFLLTRKLISRNMKLYNNAMEIIYLDKSDVSVTFYPMRNQILMYSLSPTFPYKIKLKDQSISLEIFQNASLESQREEKKSEKWLSDEILPKILKWCKYRPEMPVIPSLNLISATHYNTVLHYLKDRYGKHYVNIWPNYNNTDPLKYVYEDISICAYLITLWEEEREKFNLSHKQKFVDLACGNGLLVDILTSEGYSGVGIDLRKRKIWEAFKCKDYLIEMTIEPNNHNLFPNYDWIIGNHPDELTPWIPFIATRSNYKMKMFLMPCCYYNFIGKYSRCDAGLTQYQSYLKFIKRLCEAAGYKVMQDKLRIPSTKRICFVCTSRSYAREEEAKLDKRRSELIHSESSNQKAANSKLMKESVPDASAKSTKSSEWVSGFTPRQKKELVQNCTEVNKKVIDDIVFAVVEKLLSEENFQLIKHDNGNLLWNAGGASTIQDLIKSFDSKLLSGLKKQNGGFQTLLRNHHNVFEIKEGHIRLKIPKGCQCTESPGVNSCSCGKIRSGAYKTKKCFFHFHHPQGCPLSSEMCTYLHVN